MTGTYSDRSILMTSLAFIGVLTYAIYHELWFLLVAPAVLAVVGLALYKPKFMLISIFFMTPLSLNLEDLAIGGVSFYLPTEPLLFGMMFLIILAQWHAKIIPSKVIKHPLSIAILCYLFWVLITAMTSVSPMVSFKFLLAKLWFIIPVYFAGATIFLKEKRIRPFFIAYIIPFVAVVLFTLIEHRSLGWDEGAAHWVMEPFYRDHTQYGAVLAFFIPVTFGFLVEKGKTVTWRAWFLLALILLIVAVIFTFSRAAWLSLVLAFGLWFLTALKIKPWVVVGASLSVLLVLMLSFNAILLDLQMNKTDSGDDLVENVTSITNISTDASNLERLNRWNAVFAMAKEKPFFGFGPGTYMFEYAPYQQAKDLTIISTNFGDVGNAHSEYFGPLAESGVFGIITVVVMVFILFRTAYQTFHRLEPGPKRHLLMMAAMALVTYFSHGFLNNFLDSDKASVPVFGAMAVIVALDIISRERQVQNSDS